MRRKERASVVCSTPEADGNIGVNERCDTLYRQFDHFRAKIGALQYVLKRIIGCDPIDHVIENSELVVRGYTGEIPLVKRIEVLEATLKAFIRDTSLSDKANDVEHGILRSEMQLSIAALSARLDDLKRPAKKQPAPTRKPCVKRKLSPPKRKKAK